MERRSDLARLFVTALQPVSILRTHLHPFRAGDFLTLSVTLACAGVCWLYLKSELLPTCKPMRMSSTRSNS